MEPRGPNCRKSEKFTKMKRARKKKTLHSLQLKFKLHLKLQLLSQRRQSLLLQKQLQKSPIKKLQIRKPTMNMVKRTMTSTQEQRRIQKMDSQVKQSPLMLKRAAILSQSSMPLNRQPACRRKSRNFQI